MKKRKSAMNLFSNNYGFTGTSRGMTSAQYVAFEDLFSELPVGIWHHGDCIGADQQSHAVAAYYDAFIEIHPPINSSKRARCVTGRVHLHDVKPYLERNKDIVRLAIDGMIATPRQMFEPVNRKGEGTWTTIVYARQAGRKIWIILPDGSIKLENM